LIRFSRGISADSVQSQYTVNCSRSVDASANPGPSDERCLRLRGVSHSVFDAVVAGDTCQLNDRTARSRRTKHNPPTGQKHSPINTLRRANLPESQSLSDAGLTVIIRSRELRNLRFQWRFSIGLVDGCLGIVAVHLGDEALHH